jgi:hypothetical protein
MAVLLEGTWRKDSSTFVASEIVNVPDRRNEFFSEVGLSPLGTVATSGLLYKPQMIDEDDCGAIGGMKIGRGNRSTRKKTCPSATLSTTNPAWLDTGSISGRRGGKPATNRLSYGAAGGMSFFLWGGT